MGRQYIAVGLLLIISIFLQTSCGGTKPAGSLELSTSPASDAGFANPNLVDVSPTLLTRLAAELERALVEHGSLKRTATAPNSDLSQVVDFHMDETTVDGTTFSWSYRNQGDYDQNGEVNGADISPIAINFMLATGGDGWFAALPVDGDGNGEINLSDITPIAIGFRNVANGYVLQVSATPEDGQSWTQLAAVPFSTGVLPEGGGFLQFSILLAAPPNGNYLRVVPYFGDPEGTPELGIPSNEILAAELAAPLDLTASQGDYTAQIRLAWTPAVGATGYEIFKDSSDSPFASVGDVAEWFDDPVDDLDEHNYWLKGLYPSGTSDLGNPVTGFVSRRGDWWMFGREPTHNFNSPILGPQSNDLKWVFQAGQDILFCSPSIAADGTIYIGTADFSNSHLIAINADGSEKWRVSTPGPIESSPAVAKDGTVYFGTTDSFIALNPDGSQAWTYPISGFILSAPAVGEDGTIYIGDNDGLLYAINPSGSLRWGRPTSDGIWCSPAIGSDGTIYVGNESGQFYGINPVGDINWTFNADGYLRSSPAIGADGAIYFGSGGGTFYALNPTGKERWNYPVGSAVFSSPAIASDGTVYFGSDGGDLFALNPNGTLKWRYETGELIWVETSPTIGSDGVVYFGAGDGKYYALNADGTLLWEYQAEAYFTSSGAIAEDGTMYVPSNDGLVFAFGTPEPVPPLAPSGLTATDGILFEAIRLDWDKMYGVTTFEIFKDGLVDPVSTVDGTTTSWVDTPIGETSPHTYKVQAVNAFGSSLFSNEVTGTANTSPPGPGDWYMFGHDQAHTRLSTFAGPSTESLEWSTSIGAFSYSSVAVGNYGEVYVGGGNSLHCVNVDGTVRWSFEGGGEISCSPAMRPDGTIYIGDWSGKMYAISPAGTELWNYQTGGVVYSSPNIADDGTIYFGSVDTKLYALNPDGSLKWDYPTAGEIWSSPAIGSDGTVYFGNNDNKVFGVNPDGSLKWSADTAGEVRSSPAVLWDEVLGDTIYIGCHDFKLYAFDSDGTPLWDYTTGAAVFSSPAIGPDGTIYAGSNDNLVYALNPDGTLKWSSDLFAPIGSSPAVDANGVVWIGDSAGYINAINPDGTWLWFGSTLGNVWDSSPAVSPAGTVYITDTSGYLYAFVTGS